MNVERLRPVWIGLTTAILVLTGLELVALYRIIDDQQSIGADLNYYQFVAQRWLDTGVLYIDQQLDGPYEVQTQVHNLYPPHALYLFVPFVVLPGALWWILPLSFIAYVVWWSRPRVWAWPILAAILLFPKTPNQILYGNTDMWLTAFIAGGVRWGWPAVLVSIKPSMAPFALLGIALRSWWIAAAVLAVLSGPFLFAWLDYPRVMLNSSAKFWYSFSNVPFFVLPLVAWLASSRRLDTPVGAWAASLARGGADTLRRKGRR